MAVAFVHRSVPGSVHAGGGGGSASSGPFTWAISYDPVLIWHHPVHHAMAPPRTIPSLLMLHPLQPVLRSPLAKAYGPSVIVSCSPWVRLSARECSADLLRSRVKGRYKVIQSIASGLKPRASNQLGAPSQGSAESKGPLHSTNDTQNVAKKVKRLKYVRFSNAVPMSP